MLTLRITAAEWLTFICVLNNPKSRCFSVYHSFPPVSTRLPFVSTRFYSFSTRLLLVCIRLQSFTTRLHSSHLLEPSLILLFLIFYVNISSPLKFNARRCVGPFWTFFISHSVCRGGYRIFFKYVTGPKLKIENFPDFRKFPDFPIWYPFISPISCSK